MHDSGVDSLIDGVLGGGGATATTTATTTATATIVDAPADTIVDTPRKPISWPPKPGERKSVPEKSVRKKGLAGLFERMKPKSTRDGHWNYNGLRPKTRVLAISLVVAALIGAGIATMRALASSAASTFPGAMAAEAPLQLNFSTSAVLEKVYVSVGQTVKIGQPLAAEQSNVLAAQLVADRITFASDEQRLAQLLGNVGKAMQVTAAQAYAKANQQAVSSQQRGAQNIVDDNAILAAEQQNLGGAEAELSAAQAEYNTKCSKGLGSTDCASLSARVSGDTSRVSAIQQEMSVTQSKLTAAQSTDKMLNQLSTQLQATAQANKAFFNAAALDDITHTRDALAADQLKLTSDLSAMQSSVMTSPVNGKVLAIGSLVGENVGPTSGSHSSAPGALPGSQGNGGPSTVGTGTTTPGLITIEEVPGLDATAQVPESSILSIKRGEAATITVDGYNGQSIAGHVTLVEPQPVLVSGSTYYDVLIVPNSGTTWPATLLPGMTANIVIGH
jgi:multidrug resistance efflux pump